MAGAVQAALATRFDYLPLDIRLTEEWQRLDPDPLEPLISALNHHTNELRVVMAAIVAASCILAARPLLASFIALPIMALVVNSLLKALIDRPRPSETLVQVTERAAGPGFPSGHVMNSVIILGFLCVLANDCIRLRPLRLAVQATSVVVIAFTGPARVYTGAHWPSDVIAGYVFGAIVLLPLIWVYRALRPHLGGALGQTPNAS